MIKKQFKKKLNMGDTCACQLEYPQNEQVFTEETEENIKQPADIGWETVIQEKECAYSLIHGYYY